MLEKLDDFIKSLSLELRHVFAYGTGCLKDWDSLVINKRKPYTYRAFKQYGDYRICLHKFDPCSDLEAFGHPHPWPGAFIILEGSYEQRIGYADSRNGIRHDIYREVLTAGSKYEIVNPLTFHSVIPLETTWTMMVNGPPFENPHEDVVTTKGKDLQKMTPKEFEQHMYQFANLICRYEDCILL